MTEYGGGVEKPPSDTTVMLTPAGFKMSGTGIRMDLDNYRDLICWLKQEICHILKINFAS